MKNILPICWYFRVLQCYLFLGSFFLHRTIHPLTATKKGTQKCEKNNCHRVKVGKYGKNCTFYQKEFPQIFLALLWDKPLLTISQHRIVTYLAQRVRSRFWRCQLEFEIQTWCDMLRFKRGNTYLRKVTKVAKNPYSSGIISQLKKKWSKRCWARSSIC